MARSTGLRIARSLAYRAGRLRWMGVGAFRRLLKAGRPRVLANSFQKSGTYLLLGAVSRIPGYVDYDRSVVWHYLNRCLAVNHPKAWDRTPTVEEIIRSLRSCLPGEVFRGHLAAAPVFTGFFRNPRYRNIFIYRDPRDVVVSLKFWWERHEEIDAWPFRYFRRLETDEERLTFLIEGWPTKPRFEGFPAEVAYPDVGTRLREFLPWLSHENCHSVRFEDMVDPESREEAYGGIFDYLEPDADPETRAKALLAMEVGADPKRSRTFFKGRRGAWREHLNASHVEAVNRCAGDLLVRLGYE